MGRFYQGDIYGKFWFAVQSSGSMEDYGAIEQATRFEYKICGCQCESQRRKSYCEDCYDSYQEHLTEVREQDDDDDDDDKVCFQEDTTGGEWIYDLETFEEQGIPFIEKNKDLFNKYIKNITFDEDNSYDVEWVKEDYGKERNEDDEILADLCMLKQIQHFFQKENQETCSWIAEY